MPLHKEKLPNHQIEKTVKELYQQNSELYNFQPDYLQIDRYIEIYANQGTFNNRVVFLYDHKRMQIVYASENVVKISGYTPAEIKAFGIRFYFKVFHPTHYSFVFKQVLIDNKLFPRFSKKDYLDRKVFIGGLKLLTKNGQLKRGFLSIKALVVNDKNLPELSILYGEDYTHLFKGKSYWIRVVSEDITYCFVNNYGKKEFKDLISKRELEIIKLVALHHTTQQIAQKLNISTSTVNNHRKNMIARSGATNLTALVHLCKRAELL